MDDLKANWWKLVRFGFHLLYNEMAFTYDSVANIVSLGQWWDWQRSALPFLPPPESGLILELAHGTGRLQRDLYVRGYHSIALDFSPYMGRMAKKRGEKWDVPMHLIRARAQEMPFPENTFAAIISTFPTPFIIEPETLDEIRRILKPGASLVIVPQGVLTKGGVARAALEKAYEVTGQRGGWPDLNEIFAGFDIAVHQIEHKWSTATVIVAQVKDND